LPLINSGAVALLDNERMLLQLVSLERTTTAVRDRVDHPKGLHDDLANAAAGALVSALMDSGCSPQQRFRDNLKLAAACKQFARSIA